MLTVGDPIRFGSGGNYGAFSPQGFAQDDNPTHTWNDGFVASITFQMAAPSAKFYLRIDADPFVVADKVPFQDLSIYLSGLWIGFTRANRGMNIAVAVDVEYLAAGDNVLSFVMPNATRPREIAVGDDVRALGFAFHEISMSTKA